MSDISIENKIIMKSLAEIKPYEHNARRNDKTVQLLCDMIPKVGFNVPIVIDSDGVIVKGHARYIAAEKLEMKEVPCIVTHADAESIRADRIADNKISEFTEWITDELMDEINALDFDLSELGLPKVDLTDVPTAEVIKAESPLSEEEKERLYQEFKAEREAQAQAQANSSAESNSTSSAESEFGSTPYYKCVCDKCGYIMFIKEGEFE